MSIARRRRRAVVAMAIALVGAGGCGGDEAADQARDARDYASRVAQISTRTGDRLAALSARADYREADAAADSTAKYAAAIRDAAARLRNASPPSAVQAQQDALVRLYDQTAGALDALAGRFRAADDPVKLAALAQQLSEQIQRYASQEQQIRDAIQRTLAVTTTPAP